jgi:hypothetical protein
MSDAPGRRCRIVGDTIIFAGDKPQIDRGWPRDRAAVDLVEADPAVHREAGELPIGSEVAMRIRHDHVVEVAPATEAAAPHPPATPAARDDELPERIYSARYGGPPKQFVGPFDRLVRRRELEAYASGWGHERVRVYAANVQNQPTVGAVTDGHSYVVMNVASRFWRCPVTRLGVLAHELHHHERGDVSGPVDQDAEGECDEAAQAMITGLVATVDQKNPDPSGKPTDASVCKACFVEQRTACRQSESALARVMDTFARLLGLSEE